MNLLGASTYCCSMLNVSARAEGSPCTAELIPALYGLEGRRVELTFHDGRRLHCLIGRRLDGVLEVHVAKRNEDDVGEVLVFGDFRVARVLSP